GTAVPLPAGSWTQHPFHVVAGAQASSHDQRAQHQWIIQARVQVGGTQASVLSIRRIEHATHGVGADVGGSRSGRAGPLPARAARARHGTGVAEVCSYQQLRGTADTGPSAVAGQGAMWCDAGADSVDVAYATSAAFSRTGTSPRRH